MTAADTVSVETVISAIPVGVAVVDSGNRLVLMNSAFYTSLGFAPTRFPPGTNLVDLVRAASLHGPGFREAWPRLTDGPSASRPWRDRCAGGAFDLLNTPLADGGSVLSIVRTHADPKDAATQTAAALDTLRIGLAIFDPHGDLLLSNPRFAELMGLPVERLTSGFAFDHILGLLELGELQGSEDAGAFLEAMRGAGRGRQWAAKWRRHTGQLIDVMGDPLAGGGWTITANDITPLAMAEDEASRRAHLLDSVLLAVPHGICVYGPDRRVTMFNQAYQDVMTGAPLCVGDHLADVIRRRSDAGEYGTGAPDDVFIQQMGFDISRPQTRRRLRANGTAIDVRTAPLPDGGHISVVTDITALVEAEAQTRRRAEEMYVMLRSIRHGIILWNADSQLVVSNPMATQMFDFPPDLLSVGRSESAVVEAMLRQGDLGEGENATARAQSILARDHSLPSESELRTASGRVLAVQNNPAPAGGWVSTMVDISKARSNEAELRQAKEVAEAANKAKSQFLATMSHELRTPLNAIIGFSDALVRDTARCTADDIAEYGGQINAAGKQLLALINTILDVARIETGRFDPGEELVDVPTVLRRAVRQTESAALAAELSLVLNVPNDLPQLRADERRLLRVLSQLLSNAIKFTEAGGRVTVEAGLSMDGDLWLRVEDTGIGIEPAELERVFEPFTQVDDTLARRYGGTGLGLYTARAIVNAQGGRMRLTSRPGSGTTVEITMPGRRLAHSSGV